MKDNLDNELNIGDKVVIINNSQMKRVGLPEEPKPALTIGYIVGFTKTQAIVYVQNSRMIKMYQTEDRFIEDDLIKNKKWDVLKRMYSTSLHKSHLIIKIAV